MKIFIDVGMNQGQTISAILEPTHGFDRLYCKYKFDRIYGFEPVPQLHALVKSRFRDSRFTLYPAGLWKETCSRPVYSPGTQSASIFPDKTNVDPSHTLQCNFIRASDWFRDHIADNDEVYMKLNCEGSEADIIEDLLDADQYFKLTSVLVAFDVRKVPSQTYREDVIKRRLQENGCSNLVEWETLPGQSRRERIERWLTMCGAARISRTERWRHVVYRVRTFLARASRYAGRRLSHRER
jgi:FkbM family methyltransferase